MLFTMNRNVLAGLCILLLLVGLQWTVQRIKVHRMKRWWDRAAEALKTGELDAAAAALNKCVSLTPMWAQARTLLGFVQAKQGKLKEAEAQLKMAAELQPRQAEGHIQLGLFYATQFSDRDDDAIEALLNGVKCAPELRNALSRDPRLARLRNHPRFPELTA